MSRSYKHHPYFKCAGDTSYKKLFNRWLRRTKGIEEIPDGNAYRKIYCSWEIADFIFNGSWEEFKQWSYNEDKSEEELWAEWKRLYGSK